MGNPKCTFITITNESKQSKTNPISKLLSSIQDCIAKMIGEETSKIKARYFHLFIDKQKNGNANTSLISQQIITIFLNNKTAKSETTIHI